MPVEILVGLGVFAAMFFLVLAFGGGEATMRSRLDSLRAQPRGDEPEAPPRRSVSQRLIAPTTEALVQQVKRVMPTSLLDGLQTRLVLAGEPMTVNGFLTFHLIMSGTFVLLPFVIILAAGASFGPIQLVAVGGFALVGFFLPQMWLSQRCGQRKQLILKSLPDAFDLITVCVEAGLGLDAALARVAEKVEGPFANELARSLREISLGKMRREAFRELGQRSGVADLITFTNAVIQAEQMGSSVGTVLRVQAEQLRVRRRQRAEAQAYRAPIKMLFPLVFCIFPTLFIVILGPAVITIMRDFPGG